MGIYVNTNVSALKGQNYLNKVNTSLNTTYERLSSGLRINSAKDDAAGLQIANRLTAQINGLNQANRNANDGIALAQTIESGLDEISNMLQRVRTLAVQSANGINTQEDRDALTAEAAQLTDEITRIAQDTTYAGKTILCGYDDTGKTSIYSNSGSATPINGGNAVNEGLINFQIGANSGDTIQLAVHNFTIENLESATGVTLQGTGGTVNGYMPKNKYFKLGSQADASQTIADVDKMLQVLDSQRSSLGAIQNRLESSINVQAAVATNESDARSRIRDTDFAEESAKLSQQSIIQQAATSMLMQANTRPQIGLSLLG